jgi:hypothetical protein
MNPCSDSISVFRADPDDHRLADHVETLARVDPATVH